MINKIDSQNRTQTIFRMYKKNSKEAHHFYVELDEEYKIPFRGRVMGEIEDTVFRNLTKEEIIKILMLKSEKEQEGKNED